MSSWFPKLRLAEADGLYTAMVEYPPGAKPQFAFVLETRDLGLRLYYFLTREQLDELLTTLIEERGYDA